jgi:glycosyltransferase involved in cell wall biosynthesis
MIEKNNNMAQPLVSIVMPTFNSAKIITKALASIREQNYPQAQIEILVVDGGSTDQTCVFAKQYGAIVLENPKTQQEYAKHIGLMAARGKYVVFLDSDEVFERKDAITLRIDLMERNPRLKMVLSGGYRRPPEVSAVNDYINTFSDPFAFFMNRICPDARFFPHDMAHKYGVRGEDKDSYELVFDATRSLPVVDLCAGNTIVSDYLREALGSRLEKAEIIPRVFYELVTHGAAIAVLKSDAIVHYSADNFRTYFRKLRWRVIVNTHYQHIPGTGFANRESFQPLWYRGKKYLFVPYAWTLVLPLIDSIYYWIRTRQVACLMHVPLSFYTASHIALQFARKLFGSKPAIFTYGQETKRLDL